MSMKITTVLEFRKSTAILLLVLAVFFVYGSSLQGPFIWDDYPLIVDNPIVKDLCRWTDVFRTELHTGTQTNYYRPLQALSFMSDYRLFRLDPFGFHLTNVLLHLFTGFVFFYLLLALTQRFFVAFCTILVFLIHPVHAEAVAYISGRADILMTFFTALSGWFYVKAALGPGRTKSSPKGILTAHRGSVFLSIACFVLALLSKETAVFFPFVLWLIEAVFLKRNGWGRRGLPFFLLAGLYVLLRLTVLNFSGGDPLLAKKGFAFFEVAFPARCVLFLKTLIIYLGSLFVPLGLHMDRLLPYEKVQFFHWLGFSACLIVFVRLFFKTGGARRMGVFSLAWFFIWLLPQSAFLFPNIMADHFIYTASLGIFLSMACFLDEFIGSRKALFVAALAIYLGSCTVFYSTLWSRQDIFLRWTSRWSPMSYKARDDLATIYLRQGRPQEAVREYRAILDPEGDLAEARDFSVFAQKVLSRPPAAIDSKLAAISFFNLGVLFADSGQEREAVLAYRAALRLDPRMPRVHNNLGILLERGGQNSAARLAYEKAIASDESYVPAYNNLAVLYAREGKDGKAASLWQKALRIDPGYETARKNLEMLQGPSKD